MIVDPSHPVKEWSRLPLQILQDDKQRVEQALATLELRLRKVSEDKADTHDGGDVFHDPVFKELSQQERALLIQKSELEQILKMSEVVAPDPMPYVSLGKFVSVEFDGGETDNLWVVGIAIGDPPEGFQMVSADSPLGQAIMGKGFQQTAEYIVGPRRIKVKVLKIRKSLEDFSR